MLGRAEVGCGVLSLTLFMFLLALVVNVTPVADLDGTAHQSTVVVSDPERRGMLVAGTPHGPIVIDGDANFSATALAEGWLGNGSAETPYIIDGLEIDLGGNNGSCILINNTRSHFTISNCILTGAAVNVGSGVYLYNVTNGELIDNTCTNNSLGIYLDDSNSNTLANNTCHNNDYGIYLRDSNSNTVANNTCTSNQVGIYLYYSDSNTLVNNTCTSNTWGIWIIDSDSNTLSKNTCSSNTDIGIYLHDSSSNIAANNTISSNYYGIQLYGSNLNTLANNTCTSNGYGIYVDASSDLNDIQWNVFVNSLTNGYDSGTGNFFDYNYWSDYLGTDANEDGFGDAPYTFSNNSDPHPLVYLPTPPQWTQSPVEQTVEVGFLNICDLNATPPAPLFWHLNDTLFRVDSEGVITSWIILPAGIYGLEVVVTNFYGLSLTGSFRVIILDTISPHWLVEPSDQVLQHDGGLDYQLLVADLSGLDHWTLNDTSHFALTATFYHQGSTARLVNTTALEPGIYPLSVSVYDRFGNSISVIFSVTVITTAGAEGIDPTLTFAVGTGVGGAAVIVIVAALARKRE